jgi:hypothetical protein
MIPFQENQAHWATTIARQQTIRTPTNDLVDRISPIQGRVHKTLKCASSQLHNLWSELAPRVFRYNTL